MSGFFSGWKQQACKTIEISLNCSDNYFNTVFIHVHVKENSNLGLSESTVRKVVGFCFCNQELD